jgi:hypothetical protein
MIPLRFGLLIAVFVTVTLISGCGKDSKEDKQKVTNNKEFGWKDGVSVSDIPDYPLKGSLGGKEVQFLYINFEKWRGSGDNVLVFSLAKPSQPCGYIEDFQGIQLVNKGNPINQGEWVKGKFDDDPRTYQSYFRITGGDKSTAGFNCALVIESMDSKVVKGRIAIFFNDDKKSWAAGKFEATICNN